MKEVWRKIPGFTRYCISSMGRINSVRYKGKSKSRLLTLTVGMDGYYRVSIYNRAGERKSVRVNRLVLLAFKGSGKNKDAAHLNGDRLDNRLVNLKWATRAENHGHKRAHGTDQVGTRNSNARLTERDVRQIRRLYAAGKYDGVQLAKRYGVRHPTIYSILNRRLWPHV